MDALNAFFMATGIWFWVSFAVISLLFFWSLEKENYAGLFFGTLALVVAAEYLTTLTLFSWTIEKPWTLVYWLAGYAAIGMTWSVVRWWFFVHAKRREYDELKQMFLISRRVRADDPVVPESLRAEWKEYLERHRSFGNYGARDSFPPHPRDYKARITGWIAWWPWSMVWTLIDDPMRRMGEWLYYRVANALKRISERAFSGTEEDLRVPETKESPDPQPWKPDHQTPEWLRDSAGQTRKR